MIRQRDAVKRQQHLGDDVERIKRLEYKQFSKLAVLMAKTSPTASSVSYDIINQCRFPGLYGQLLKHEENAKHVKRSLAGPRNVLIVVGASIGISFEAGAARNDVMESTTS